MDARGDVANEMAAQRRRRSKELHEDASVELERLPGNSDVEMEALESIDPLDLPMDRTGAARAALASAFDDQDRQLLDLMAQKVRETAAYAEVLGISHLPLGVQADTVKRHKDRLTKRMERLRERL